MKAFNKPVPHGGTAGLILLLAEKSAPRERSHDERSQTDILTPGLNLAPAFPVR